jgi:prevent-host-death family protein
MVNIHEAKTNFSRLVERAEHGEEILIGRSGKPVARLVPYQVSQTSRVPGGWKGRVQMTPDFEDLPPDVAAAFRGDLP